MDGSTILPAAEKAVVKVTHNEIQTKSRGAAYNCLVLAAFGAGVGIFSLLLGSATCGASAFFSYFLSPLVLALNILPPVLLVLFVYFICGKAWLSFTLTGGLTLTLATINYFKLLIRGDPLLGEDMALVSESGIILQSYSLPVHWTIVFAAVFFAAGIFITARLLKGARENPRYRIIGGAAVALVSAALYLLAYRGSAVYNATSPSDVPVPFSEGYISRGFIYSFLHSTSVKPEPPEGYSEEAVEQVFASVDDGGIPVEKRVNVVSIMLESYADMSAFDMLEFNVDIYGPLHELQRESVSGMLIDNVFAGGTIDTERLFLTGFTKLENYVGPVNSFVHYLRSQGYAAEGLHAGDRWFYDREKVNSWLGFENYYFLEDYENSTREDSFFFPEVLRLYRERDRSKPYFSYSLSYQNHGAYPEDYTEEPYYINGEGMSEAAFNTLNNYFAGIYDTNLRLSAFIDEFRSDPEPVVIVVFGDHMPLLGNSEAVYRELGINVDVTTGEGFYNLYSTPYFIWANDAARKALGNSFTGDGGSFSPCFLMTKLFDQCSWEGGEYMQLLRDLRGQIDVINAPTGFFRERGKLTYELSDEAAKYYEEFKNIEFYRLNNFVFGETEPDSYT